MDIVEFFEKHNIHVSIDGNNVSPGWIGIQCKFCNDSSNHLGIRLKDLKTHCWKCGRHSIYSVVQILEKCDFKEAKKIIKSLEKIEVKIWERPDVRKKEQIALKRDFIPKEASNKMIKQHFDYLHSRELNPFLTAKKYELLFVGPVGKYKFRIIIPFFYKGVCYSFTSRSVSDDLKPKYLQPNRAHVPITPKQTLYNIDNLKKYHDCILCEGPVDVWKFGDGAVALSGLTISDNQFLQLRAKRVRALYIMMDNDIRTKDGKIKKLSRTRKAARILYRLLKPTAQHTEIIKSEVSNDLGEMTREQALRLKQILNFNKNI